MDKNYKVKIVMYGLLVETKEHEKQLEEGFEEMGLKKPILIGSYRTLPGEGGEGGRSDVILLVHNDDVGQLALHPLHLNGGFSWSDDYFANHKGIIPTEMLKHFKEEN